MISSISLVGLSFGASVVAIVPHILPHPHVLPEGPIDGKYFTLKAHGLTSASVVVGQLGDGQNRIGGGRSVGKYHFKDGGVWDEHGHGCILTPSTTQWQCDQGVKRFAVDCHGKFTYRGGSIFYACPVNDHGEWNIYTKPVVGQLKCVTITLTAEGSGVPGCAPQIPSEAPKKTCGGDKNETNKCQSPKPSNQRPSTHPRPSTYLKPSPQPTRPFCKGKACVLPPPPPPPTPYHKKTCPLDLSGPFEYPHLIVPVDSKQPHEFLGNSLNGTIKAPNRCTTFNFDIHPRFAGRTCSVIFLLPHHSNLETSAYELHGADHTAVFKLLDWPVSYDTTWSNKPSGKAVKTVELSEGSKHHILTTSCAAGTKVAYEVCGTGELGLNYFQDYNPSAIGLYVRVC